MASSSRPFRKGRTNRHLGINQNTRTLPRYIHKTGSGKYRIIKDSKQIGPSHETVELAVAYLRANTDLKIKLEGKPFPNPLSLAGKILAILESTPGKHYCIMGLLPEYSKRKIGFAVHVLRTRYLFDIAAYPVKGHNHDWSYQLCGHWRGESGEYHDYLNNQEMGN